MNEETKFVLDDASDRVEIYTQRIRLVLALFLAIAIVAGSAATVWTVGNRMGKFVVFPLVLGAFGVVGLAFVVYMLVARPAAVTLDSRRIRGQGFALDWDEVAAIEVVEGVGVRGVSIVAYDREASLAHQPWWFRKMIEQNRGGPFERLTFHIPSGPLEVSHAELLQVLRQYTDKPIVEPIAGKFK